MLLILTRFDTKSIYLLKRGGVMIILWPAIITMVFFFHSGRNKHENGIKWAIVGVIGYILGFSLSIFFIGETFISIFIACLVVYFAHTQLSRMAEKNTAKL